MLNEDYNEVEEVPNQFMLSETSARMPKSMNSFCRSVENQRDLENKFQEIIPTMRPISMDHQTRSEEYMNLKFHGSSERKKPDEMEQRL